MNVDPDRRVSPDPFKSDAKLPGTPLKNPKLDRLFDEHEAAVKRPPSELKDRNYVDISKEFDDSIAALSEKEESVESLDSEVDQLILDLESINGASAQPRDITDEFGQLEGNGNTESRVKENLDELLYSEKSAPQTLAEKLIDLRSNSAKTLSFLYQVSKPDHYITHEDAAVLRQMTPEFLQDALKTSDYTPQIKQYAEKVKHHIPEESHALLGIKSPHTSVAGQIYNFVRSSLTSILPSRRSSEPYLSTNSVPAPQVELIPITLAIKKNMLSSLSHLTKGTPQEEKVKMMSSLTEAQKRNLATDVLELRDIPVSQLSEEDRQLRDTLHDMMMGRAVTKEKLADIAYEFNRLATPRELRAERTNAPSANIITENRERSDSLVVNPLDVYNKIDKLLPEGDSYLKYAIENLKEGINPGLTAQESILRSIFQDAPTSVHKTFLDLVNGRTVSHRAYAEFTEELERALERKS